MTAGPAAMTRNIDEIREDIADRAERLARQARNGTPLDYLAGCAERLARRCEAASASDLAEASR